MALKKHQCAQNVPIADMVGELCSEPAAGEHREYSGSLCIAPKMVLSVEACM